jgi:hypothetical protein
LTIKTTPYRTLAELPEEMPMSLDLDQKYNLSLITRIGTAAIVALVVLCGTGIETCNHSDNAAVLKASSEAEKAKNESFKALWEHTVPPNPPNAQEKK